MNVREEGSPLCCVISHCFMKIAVSDDGNFILSLHETKVGVERWKRVGEYG